MIIKFFILYFVTNFLNMRVLSEVHLEKYLMYRIKMGVLSIKIRFTIILFNFLFNLMPFHRTFLGFVLLYFIYSFWYLYFILHYAMINFYCLDN